MNPYAPNVRRDRFTGNLVPVDFSFDESEDTYAEGWSAREVVDWVGNDLTRARIALAREQVRTDGRRKGVMRVVREILSG